MTLPEITTNGTDLRVVHRPKVAPIAQLGPNQVEWLERRHPGISRNRVQRAGIADYLRATVAYRIAEYVDEARQHVRRTV